MSVNAFAVGGYVGCLWDNLRASLKGSFIFSKAKSNPEYTYSVSIHSAFQKFTLTRQDAYRDTEMHLYICLTVDRLKNGKIPTDSPDYANYGLLFSVGKNVPALTQ